VADQLAEDYDSPSKRAYFLEHDVDKQGPRRSMWWTARGGASSATTPLIMVDSGFQITEGSHADFRRKYKGMIDAALARAAQAEVHAYYERDGTAVRATVEVTNRSGETIGYDNNARVWMLVFEDKEVIHMKRFVRAEASVSIEDDLADGATGSYQVTIERVTGVNWDKTHVLVLVDYRPRANGPYSLLQAQEATFGVPRVPTAEPTAEPTDEPLPTIAIPTLAPPEPTATDEPEPTAAPPESFYNYLPVAKNE
jgi:hypothetical protein